MSGETVTRIGGLDLRRVSRIVDGAFYPLLVLYSLYALGWLVLGLGFGAIADIPALHHLVDTWQATAAPHTFAARIAHGLQVGIMHSETGAQVILDYLFSLLNVALSVVLLRSAPADRTVRLLVVGMIGSAGAFNLQAHADIYAVQDALGISIGWWHTALLHGVGGVCYVFALLMFPTGSLGFGGRTRWLSRTVVFGVVAATVGLLSVSTASYPHPVSFVVFFGLLAPVAGLAAQLRRYSAATTAESRQQSRVLLWTLFMAFGAAALMSALTVVIATIQPAGLTTESSDALFFWICRAVFTMIPCALLVGVLRFRLWDVELLLNRTFVYGVLSVLIASLYVGVVVAADWLLNAPGRANLPVQLLAGAVVVLALRPARTRISALANRLVHGRRPAPYDVLAQLSALSRTTVTDATVLPLLARVTGEGLQVASCEVRLRLHDGTDRRYRWPAGSGGISPAHVVDVYYDGEQVGEFAIDRGSAVGLAPEQRRLLTDLAHGAGLVLRTVRLTIDLEQQLGTIAKQANEISLSRRRIMHAQEAERRTLERNLHDGAQPQLVAVRMSLGLMAHLIGTGNTTAAAALIDQLDSQLAEADNDLTELSNGLYPSLLRERGLLPALRDQAVKLGIDATFTAPDPLSARRLPSEVEAAVCLAVMEALQNAAKHAPRSAVHVELSTTAGELRFVVADSGPGFVVAHQHRGVGLQS
ncbi:MAG TPA: ATP-binding protein, partial [Pseudonocardiaceae bacterium]|nr:ATP-binding protein [Pseudonocardiaceae bacterium]